MLIIGVLDESDIRTALMNANVQFGGNLEFKRFDHAGKTRHGENKFTVTLTVKDSRKPGSRRSTSGRRIAAACWHAHGRFFDALPGTTRIVTSCGQNGTLNTYPGVPWNDFNIGSLYQPMYMSEACDCQ